MNDNLDFQRIARVALGQIDSLLLRWLPGGKFESGEYKVLNPTRSDSKIGSFSINRITGAWADFATGDKGGDLISLYAYIFDLDQAAAARELADIVGIEAIGIPPVPRPAPAPPPDVPPKPSKSLWRPVVPAPPDAPAPPVAHYARGKPEKIYIYRDGNGAIIGYIYRFITSDGGKEPLPLCFAINDLSGIGEWRWMAFTEPRPLYGLDRLAARPEAPVLLVEGEKCADVALELLPEFVIISWPGGSNAVTKADWRPLYGRKVIAWADCDAQRESPSKTEKAAGIDPKTKPFLPEDKQPGTKAMRQIAAILAPHGGVFKLVDLPAPGKVADGWDIADALAEGMNAEALRHFISRVHDPKMKAEPAQEWDDRGLFWKGKELVPCLANIHDILHGDERWAGILAYNEFAYQVIKLKPPPFAGASIGEWDEPDDARAAMWLTHQYKFAPSTQLAADGVEAAARANSFNPVQDYLKGLVWDGTPRIDNWLFDYLGIAKTEYTWRVARWFLIGMVARAMKPGIKFDYALVLEGEQGRMKSSALRALGGEWFGDTDLDLHNKDSMSAIRGKWLYEISELGALARSEASKQKSFLSRQIDEFRPVYGRREIRSPRQLVFAGTTNEQGWNKDATGGRRFWPVECQIEVNHIGITEARNQLFAEAMIAFLAGERFWPTSEEQAKIFDPVQIKRVAPDAILDLLHDWVHEQIKPFSMADAACDCLKMDAGKITRDVQTRIGIALKKLGCTRHEKRTTIERFWYTPPPKDAPQLPDDENQDAPRAKIPF